MAQKEGLSRVAKLIALTGWVFLIIGILSGVAMGSSEGVWAFFLLLFCGAFFFVIAQGLVWVLDGFVGNVGADSNLFWPKKRIFAGHSDMQSEKTEKIKPPLRGVQGWLLLLVIGLMCLGPLRMVGDTINALKLAEETYPALINLPAWENYKTASWMTTAALCAAMVWAGYGLWKHHIPPSVNACISILWAVPIVALLADSLSSVTFLEVSVGDYFTGEAFTGLAQGFVSAALWTAYLKRSRRVKNTYGT